MTIEFSDLVLLDSAESKQQKRPKNSISINLM